METPPTHEKDQDDRVIYGTHPGDLGIVVIAALISLGFLYLLFGPSPFAGMTPPPGKAAAKAKIEPKPETSMMLFAPKKP